MGAPRAQGAGGEHGRSGGNLRTIIRPTGVRIPFSRATAWPETCEYSWPVIMRHSELGRRNANLCVISHNAVIWTAWRITGHGTRLRKNNRHVPGNAAHPIGESL